MKSWVLKSCRSLLPTIVIGLAIICTSCQFAIEFRLNNLSNHPINVRYSLKNNYYGLDPKLVNKHGDKNTNFSPFPEDRVNIDLQNRIVEFRLLPNEEAVLFWMSDKRGEDYKEAFNITKLNISDETGSLTLQGDEIFRSFRPIKKGWYDFGPEILGFVYEYR